MNKEYYLRKIIDLLNTHYYSLPEQTRDEAIIEFQAKDDGELTFKISALKPKEESQDGTAS